MIWHVFGFLWWCTLSLCLRTQMTERQGTAMYYWIKNEITAKDLPSCSIHQPVFALLAPQLNVTQELWRVTPALDWIIHCPRSIVMETEPCNHLRGSAHWHRQDLLVQISPQLQRMCLLSNTSPSVGFKVVSCTWFSYLINTMLLI